MTRRYHHGDLRRALIDGAIELVREQGLQGWTLRGVARRVGVSHAAPYHHFADKEALLGAVTAVGFERLTGQLEAAAAGAGEEPLARLRAIARAWIDFGVEQTGLYRVMLREVRSDAEGSPEGRAAGLGTLEVLTREIAAAQRAGAVPGGSPIARLLPAWSATHGFVQLAMLGPLPGMGLLDDFDRAVDDVVEAALRGLTG